MDTTKKNNGKQEFKMTNTHIAMGVMAVILLVIIVIYMNMNIDKKIETPGKTVETSTTLQTYSKAPASSDQQTNIGVEISSE